MDDYSESFSPTISSHSASPKPSLIKPSTSSSSGLTLVLPPLKSLFAAKVVKKTQRRSGSNSFAASPGIQDAEPIEKKAPRPVKLKPLKEVLSKLIHQIKKKDDYAFFLSPVDVGNVPGYSDVVRSPMDFGTMTSKVNRGKYRSLEDFAADFRLVITNAKIFNPPGSIYYNEAERIEAWGLDHISKASSTVIQYETDWNIDIEKDDEGPGVNVDDDEFDNAATPMEVDDRSRGRSASVASQPHPGHSSRRGPRGPYKKHNQPSPTQVSEILEPDGRLPGSKDGVGAFPPNSDWAKIMLALKLKGKRYRTKRERLRFERDGPPICSDGSLDYMEMEDPFSVMSFFVPDPPARPTLTPLYPPLFTTINSGTTSRVNSEPPAASLDPRATALQTETQHLYQSHQDQFPPTFPAATSISTNHQHPTLPFLKSDKSERNKRRYWTITRNANSRQKGKEKDEDGEALEAHPWQVSREAHGTDFGSFALLAGELAEEMRRRGVQPSIVKEGQEQEINFDLIREELDCEKVARQEAGESGKVDFARPQALDDLKKSYWSTERAAEAEEYIRDIVYGGVDGLAYVRSLAEFMVYQPQSEGENFSGSLRHYSPDVGLGIPLTKWVEKNVIDVLTEGRHHLIRETALIHKNKDRLPSLPFSRNGVTPTAVAKQVAISLNLYPAASLALAALLSINLHKIDMGALIKTSEELFQSEEEWYGKDLKERRKQQNDLKTKATNIDTSDDAMEVEEAEQTWVGVDASVSANGKTQGNDSDYELEGPEELKGVLDYTAAVIIDLNRRNLSNLESKPLVAPGDSGNVLESSHGLKAETNGTSLSRLPSDGSTEDPTLRNLRLNLLALAKRAPLDTIARLPKDLVPEHIRQFVPTLGSST